MKYPLGIQTFSEIREEQYLYIDKTEQILKMVSDGKAYFLSRPRRFGKSLLISTLEALFKGQKQLFEGLFIADSGYDFIEYPVVRMDFSMREFVDADELRKELSNLIVRHGAKYQIDLPQTDHTHQLTELVSQLKDKTGKKVVLLIDEYDKPILNNINKPALVEIKNVLRAFYSSVKALDEDLKFVFLTGVSKFAKVSVFSGMNNLRDISMSQEYATLCGVTELELTTYFDGAVDELAVKEGLSSAQLLEKIKYWYNGYLFEASAKSVYNPFSVLGLFIEKKFQNFWFSTATPTFLLDILQQQQFSLSQLSDFKIGESAFMASEPEQMDVVSLFLQTGYLTIKNYETPLYQLDFPNFEVRKSFYDSVVTRFANLNPGVGEGIIYQLLAGFKDGDIEAVFTSLENFFANIPYDITIKQEKYYQSLFYAVFSLIGLNIDAEVKTNKGRIDCVIQTTDKVYIIEFKLDGSKEQALAQIHSKNYAQKYQNTGKQLVLIGVEFDAEQRNIGDWVVEG